MGIGRIDAAELRGIEDEAIRDVVRKQEEVGLRSATDGEFRRASWHMDFIYQLGGVTRAKETMKVQFHNEQGDIEFTPAALADDGIAYVLQLSILSQQRTEALAESVGLRARVAEFGFFPFGAHFEENRPQIERVEQLSDAYHVTIGDRDLMLAYVLELTKAGA